VVADTVGTDGRRTRAAAGRPGTHALEALSVLDWEERLRGLAETGGFWITDTRGPTYAELRPYGPRTTPGFPVYPNLETRLLRAREHPDPEIAHALATCAAYAYSDVATVSMIMARMGLEQNDCRMITSSVDAMFIRSTAFLIQSRSGRVAILCYRGTEPMNFINWMTDADVAPERMSYRFGGPRATVHAGFYRNVRATRYEVMTALRRAGEGRPIRRPLPDDADRRRRLDALEALYVTGHSLGGAMAAVMAVMLRHEDKFADIADRLRAVYTFGQPMIGDHRLARACANDPFLRDQMIRYVYDGDVVPHLPPRTAGPFRHFGREFHCHVPRLPWGRGAARFTERRAPSGQTLSFLGGFGLAVLAFAGSRIQPLRALPAVYSFEDHRPHHYIAALTPHGVENEFGD
jgi:hypothetical protein